MRLVRLWPIKSVLSPDGRNSVLRFVMEGAGLGINIGIRASGGASYQGGSSAMGAAGTLDVSATLSASLGVVLKFGVQIYSIMQTIDKVCQSSANRATEGVPSNSKNGRPEPPLHYEWLIGYGTILYWDARIDQGASPEGALLHLAQAALESTWGNTIGYNDNLFGIMAGGGQEWRGETDHGRLRDYRHSGGFKACVGDYYDKLRRAY